GQELNADERDSNVGVDDEPAIEQDLEDVGQTARARRSSEVTRRRFALHYGHFRSPFPVGKVGLQWPWSRSPRPGGRQTALTRSPPGQAGRRGRGSPSSTTPRRSGRRRSGGSR